LFLDWNSRLQLPETLQTLENSIKNMEAEAEKLTEAFLIMHHTKDLFLNLLMIALLPAIGEELLFRGILQKLLTEATGKIHLSIIITGIIFSAIHMQFFGFLPRMMLGIFLGYLLLWTRTIWAPILAHFINNASAVLMSWYEQQNHLTLDEDKIGIREGELWLLFASLIITLSGCYLLYRNSTRLKTAD
jgi:membrane protease YdiL (CAAX protease family)